jgi:hypothetical protein
MPSSFFHSWLFYALGHFYPHRDHAGYNGSLRDR